MLAVGFIVTRIVSIKELPIKLRFLKKPPRLDRAMAENQFYSRDNSSSAKYSAIKGLRIRSGPIICVPKKFPT